MALTCKECGDEFSTYDEAQEHVSHAHTAEVDECLQEYIADAERDAYANLIKGTEDED